MDSMGWIAVVSIVTAGLTLAVGSIGPALGEARAVAQALASIAPQPDALRRISSEPPAARLGLPGSASKVLA